MSHCHSLQWHFVPFESSSALAWIYVFKCPRGHSREVYVVLVYLLLEAAVPPFRPQITKVLQGK